MDDLVSIIVPVYNSERFLEACILSITSQTLKNFELLLIDDGSFDSSLQICDRFSKIDKRIKFFSPPHGGVSAARNFGLQKASGKYVCFVDSDDMLESDFIEVLYKKISRSNAVAIFCNHQYLYNTKKIEKKPRIHEGFYSFNDISFKLIDDGTVTGILFGSVCAAIYNLDFIRKNNLYFESSLKRNEDGVFNLCFLKMASCFGVIDYNGYLYRQWKSSVQTTPEIDVELDKATARIRECCKDFKDLKKQIQCRSVSVVFWNSLKLANSKGSLFVLRKILKKYLESTSLESAIRYLNYENMNRYKKMLVLMLVRRQVLRFLILVKYIYPFASKFIKR